MNRTEYSYSGIVLTGDYICVCGNDSKIGTLIRTCMHVRTVILIVVIVKACSRLSRAKSEPDLSFY